jgi:Fic family protein
MNIDLTQAAEYHYDKFPPRQFDTSRILGPLLEATDALARYDQMLKGMHNSEILLAPLRGQEAVASSRMEGTFSTLEEVLELESEADPDLSIDDEYRSETVETYLYSRSLRAARDALEEGQPFSKALIRQMHQFLLTFARGRTKNPGQFKTEQNYIGTPGSSRIAFVPIAPEHLESGLDRLLEFTHDKHWSPLLRVAIGHVEFEALHPFKDGNGRVGRMLIPLQLWQLGCIAAPHFYISRYFEENKAAYIQYMRAVSKNGAWEDWCAFFLGAIKEQAFQNLQVAESTRDLYEEMKIRFSALLNSAKAVSALDFIFTNSVFRNSRFTQQAGIPKHTAARFSRVLLENGLLVPVREAAGRRSAIYGFEPLLRLVRI